MRKYSLLLIFMLPIIALAQAPASFNFQGLLTKPLSASGTNVSLKVEIKSDINGTANEFEEQHDIAVGPSGVFTLEIGSKQDLSIIDWSSSPYYLQLSIDNELLGVTEIASVPFSAYTNTAGTINALDYDVLADKPDFSNWDQDESDDFGGDYASLTNRPTLITTAQSEKIDRLLVTEPLDLDALDTDIALNSTKVSFPGFGNTAGTAFTQKWSKVDNQLYYPQGNAGINITPTSSLQIPLDVAGAVKYTQVDPAATPGMLFLDANSGLFKYYDETGTSQELAPSSAPLFGSGSETGSDVNVLGNVVVGSTTGAASQTLTVTGSRPIIRFDDTSSSSSFPKNDWEIIGNDAMAGGENYFSIYDRTNSSTPFKIRPASVTNVVNIDNSGNVNYSGANGSAKLDLTGENVVATALIGDGSQLVGLAGSGTGLVTNTGSTTIAADNDGDNNGSIIFQTASSDRMTISSTGEVGIGTAPVVGKKLSVSGDNTDGSITIDPNTTQFDVTGMRLIVFDTAPGGFLQPFGEAGQEIIVVNRSAGTIQFFVGGILDVPQYGTLTLLNTSSGWVVKHKSI